MDGSDYYLSWGGEKRMMTEDGRDDNYYWDWMFLDGAGIDDSSLSDGDDIDAELCALIDIAQTGDCTETVVSGGDREVSLASDTPASMSVPNSAARVKVASFDLEAGSEDAELNSLTVALGGLTTTSAINSDGVYLYEGETRLTEGRTVNSSTRQATFSALNLVVEAGETRTISVVVDMSTSINDGSFYFYIADEDDVDADGDVEGSFPVSGKTHSITDIDVGSVTIVKTGSIANPTLGENDAVIGKFQVQAGSGEDVSIETITLKIDQGADHSDFKLWQGSDQIGTGEYIGNKLVLFTLDSAYEIEKSKNVNFSVSADIGGQANDAVDVYLNSDADFDAVGDDYGFNVTVNRAGYDGGSASGTEASGACSATTDDCSYSTIQGGDITFSFDGPSAGDVKNGANDHTFLAFSVTSADWAEVDSMEVDVVMTDADSGGEDLESLALTDIKLVMADDGSLVAGPQELSASGGALAQAITFSDNWILEAGVTYDMVITADVADTVAEASDTFTFTIDMSQLAIDDVNNDAISSGDIVPSSDIAGYAQTVRAASLTVTLASTPTGDNTYVRGTTNVTVAGFNFTSGEGSDTEVTDLTVTVYVDENSAGSGFTAGTDGSTASTDRISSCIVIDSADSSLIAGPESVSSSSSGEIIFQNFSWDIAAGDTNTLYVRCNLANVDPGTADQFGFDIDAAADITALDDEGTSLSSSNITASTVNDSDNDFAAGTFISITGNGSLSVAVDASTPSADFVITNSTDNEVAVFEFSATNEDFEITTFTLSEEQAEDDTGTTDSTAYTNNISLVTIEYPKSDGSTGTKTASMSGNEARFTMTSGSGIYVEAGDTALVTAYVNVPASDRKTGGSATSNEKVMLDVFLDITNDDNFKAVGQGSGTSLDDDDLTATSSDPNTFVVRQTQPTVTLHASSPSGTGKVPGDQEVFRFTVAASSNKAVVLNNLIWKIASTDNASTNWNQCDTDNSGSGAQSASAADVDTTDFDLYNLSKEGTSTAIDANSDWTILKATGAACDATAADVGFVKVALTTPEVVPAGSSYTYALYMDTTAASASNDDSVQLTLMNDPITSTYLSGSTANETFTQTDTTLTVVSGAAYSVGDVLCLDANASTTCTSADEKALVTAISSNDLTVIRGYLGTDQASGLVATENVYRLPSAFVWEDDGSSSSSVSGEDWGAYLVDDLPLTGWPLQF